MAKKVVTLAHYYTTPEIQQMADKVGDSLELSLFARDAQADIIVFAGVRFMAETAKILNPNAEVILPDRGSTCSLVEQTDVAELRKWREAHPDYVHVSYINSSAEHKALSDWIVTSRNVDDIIKHLYDQGQKVIFSPDRNMGAYLNWEYGYNMPLWSAVCEVHDKFNEDALNAGFAAVGDTPHYLIAHPESPLPVLQRSYGSDRSRMPGLPLVTAEVPPLVQKVENLRALVAVDYYLPGCPPPADLIYYVLSELVAGRTLDLQSRAKLG